MLEILKVDNGHGFVVLGFHARVWTPINGCHSNANFAWTTIMYILVRVFLMYSEYDLFGHIVQFSVVTFSNYWGTICVNVVGNMGQFRLSKCNMVSLLWFAYFNVNICRGAQILSCSHVNLKTCPWKLQQSTSIEMHSKQPCHNVQNLKVDQYRCA